MTPVELTRALWAASKSGDHIRVRGLIADDIKSAIHVPQEVLFAGGGLRVGSAAFFDRVRSLTNTMATVEYNPYLSLVNGPYVCARVVGAVRHQASGEIFDGMITQNMKIINGKLVRFEVYYDVPKITAFMAYVSWCCADPQPHRAH